MPCIHRLRHIFAGLLISLVPSLLLFTSNNALAHDLIWKPSVNRTCDKLIVGGANGWEPVSYVDENGMPQGVAIEVLRHYAKNRGLETDIHLEIPWTRSLRMLETGQIDVIAGAYFTDQRNLEFIYSVPFANDDVMIFQHRDFPFRVSGISDLMGHRGARPQGGSYGDEIDRFAKQWLDMVYSPTGDRIFDVLLNGRVDYVMLGRYDGMANILNDKLDGIVLPVEPPLAVNKVYLMFSRNSPCLADTVTLNNLIDELDENGQLAQWVQLHLPSSNSN